VNGSIARLDDFDLAVSQVVSAADDFQAAVRDTLFEQRRALEYPHLVGHVQIDRVGFEVVAAGLARLADGWTDVDEDFGQSSRGLLCTRRARL